MCRRRIIPLVAVAVAIAVSVTSQAQQNRPQTTAKVRVEITTDETGYEPGELVRFKVMLVNEGESAIYVAKTWSYAGGGIAGFNIDAKQLTGKKSGAGCAMAGDPLPRKDGRTPEQILREDFVQLAKGELIGFEDLLRSCEVKYPGTYQVSAEYSANNFNTETVAKLSESGAPILQGKVRSRPATFLVRSTKHGLNK